MVLRGQFTDGLKRMRVLGDQCTFSECVDIFHKIVVFAECVNLGQQLFFGNVTQRVLERGTEVPGVDIGKALLAWSVNIFDIGGVCAGGRPLARVRALLVGLLDLFVIRHDGLAYAVFFRLCQVNAPLMDERIGVEVLLPGWTQTHGVLWEDTRDISKVKRTKNGPTVILVRLISSPNKYSLLLQSVARQRALAAGYPPRIPQEGRRRHSFDTSDYCLGGLKCV